ncbi:MAG: trehalose-6-phosphate synthase [Bdellovibrionia bacterium]
MRLTLRFLLPLILVLATIAYAAVPLASRLMLNWSMRDLEIRTQLIADTIHDPLFPLIEKRDRSRISVMFDRLINDERLFAVAFCGNDGRIAYQTQTYPQNIGCPEPVSPGKIVELPKGSVHVSVQPFDGPGSRLGSLVLVHDMSFVERRSDTAKKYIFYLFLVLGGVVSFITVLVAQLSWKGWVSGIRAMLKGEGLVKPISPGAYPELKPLMKDVRALIRDLERDRKVRDEHQISWSPKALKEILQRELAGDEILIVSNREPYIHNKKGDQIEVQFPASGLVTALEPVMRACSGTWIAHGSGSADREVVDHLDRVQVPPEHPSYQIRRVWLTKEQEEGYYYGFSNEGLWPLCHIAHTRPVFRSQDWQHYHEVNQKFADAVVQEAKTEDPVVLVQDYHLALLPKMIRERLPRATIITFWHIPWPNSEAFGICPWREEILEGLLGSSILGFHTRFHCNNFLDAVDRFMECRIDRDTSTISFGKKITQVNSYPISIEWPPAWMKALKPVPDCQRMVRQANGIDAAVKVGIGVDRLDYTKGILERFHAVERLLEIYPEWLGRFSFIQIAAPSRTSINEYQSFESQVRATAGRINRRFSRDGYQPIILKVEHHSPELVFEYFRGSDLCFVSSLHDGMNLVAKEFISSRDDERGVLLLSQFTGASRELPEALIINPYDFDQSAQALHAALMMSASEQRERMRSMRGLVQEFNVYRWAGRMLIDAARIRQRNRLFGKLRESVR